ncbi:hypothetical protein [Elizabethkingia meningoseptica]|uniref:hypothetical protein n=1 Tax=Elizabethkingia meningoseptica TaxID=238 RepID=UPI0023B0DC78|nr:hypothetical protein [Elizabethkingia meningoseptica]MDE5492135.1 hypothetical protein [Elizabethkingia meningoseptica]
MKTRTANTINELDYLSASQVLSDQDKTEMDFDFYLNEIETFFMEDFDHADLSEYQEKTDAEIF